MPARILVVDDVPAVRTGLRSLLTSDQLEICGEAENGRQAVDQVRELYPDVVVIDGQTASLPRLLSCVSSRVSAYPISLLPEYISSDSWCVINARALIWRELGDTSK